MAAKTPQRRSDLVRQRRTGSALTSKQPRAEKSRQVGFSAAMHSVPPVMVRGPLITATPAVSRPRGTKARRRLELPSRLPWVQVRLPSLPEISVGWRAVSGTMTVLLALLLFFLWTSPICQVASVEVNGLKRIPLEDFNHTLGFIGKPIFTVDIEHTLSNLQTNFPELAEISMQVSLPAKVMIQVKERQPVLVWMEENITKWVDADGVAFPPLGDNPPLTVVKASGPPPMITQPDNATAEQFLSPDTVKALLSLQAMLPTGTQLIYDEQHGLGWQDAAGWQVYLGKDLEDIDIKWRIYQGIVDYVTREGIQPVLISVEYLQAPFYRLEP